MHDRRACDRLHPGRAYPGAPEPFISRPTVRRGFLPMWTKRRSTSGRIRLFEKRSRSLTTVSRHVPHKNVPAKTPKTLQESAKSQTRFWHWHSASIQCFSSHLSDCSSTVRRLRGGSSRVVAASSRRGVVLYAVSRCQSQSRAWWIFFWARGRRPRWIGGYSARPAIMASVRPAGRGSHRRDDHRP